MRKFRYNRKPVACLVILALSIFSSIWTPTHAALVTTNEVIKMSKDDFAREKVNTFLNRSDVRQQLEGMGVNADLAKTRVASLTDAEVAQIADRIDSMPAGGDALSTVLIVILIVFLVLLITDIAGYTDVFPFVKSY